MPASAASPSLWHKLRESLFLLPVVLLIGAVLGSIYTGVATATEAAVLGVIGALLLSAAQGSLTWSCFTDSLMGATRTSCMIARSEERRLGKECFMTGRSRGSPYH